MADLVLHEYTWFIVVGAFAAFAFGFATGANDVANAFATSVGSKALTMKQAVLIAIVFEFVGAMVLGRVSTNVIAKGVADVSEFDENPAAYAYGMICALSSGALYQLWASYAGYNVSATQSIIGGIVGFALIWGGGSAVKWAEKDDSGKTFPPYKGVLPIILSWFIAPILTAAASALVFLVCRTLVLRRENGEKLAYVVLPFAVFLTTWVNMYFVFTKGAKKMLDENDSWSESKSKQVAAIVAAVAFAITGGLVVPLLMKRAKTLEARAAANGGVPADELTKKQLGIEGGAATDASASRAASSTVANVNTGLGATDVHKEAKPQWKTMLDATKHQLNKGINYDIHEMVETDPLVAKIHANAEKFDPKIEVIFGYLQVFSAIAVIFAHGAGEVGYMAGPLSQIYDVVKKGYVTQDSFEPQVWVLFISAFSLVVGLATYGYNVTRQMGVAMAKLTPSRGFAAELSTAMIIMVAAQYGLPTSSSQCITGGILGVGMVEGVNGVNWLFFFKQMLTWIGTLVLVGGFSALLFANAIYTPSKLCDVDIVAPPADA
jgi:sodium-dependent phosphate transporter